jgi:NAD(P)-dependent dehydrogenase (short-subunit alcohol dehydrogenase family)
MSSLPLQGRIALVTGASRGIGRAASLALAEGGAHVIAVARTVGGLEELDDAIQAKGGTTTLVPLDLKDYAGIDRMGAAIFERWGKLDILLANAGILGVLTPLTHLAPKVWDEVIAVNLTANWRLIRSLDQLLRLSDAGRALFVSSAAAIKNMPFWGGYAISKAALDTMVKTYAGELTGTTVKVNLLYPGPTRTAMRAKAMPGEDPMSLPAPEELCPLIIEMLSPDYAANGEVVRFARSQTT